ncbi:hypothetical protein [Vibrio antiquarius]|uniref:hypothetical protein n=1 Tax=Vibrio antiquarius (strain Ex25) TaxID=150340 RepID=UPI00265A5D3E|nr:hypothetical protein [Vibrio antiquarius]MCR9846726.1 hypothetical protein [Vibrio antiquarius]MCR9912323.1 hypothetical protein [Vibrio antiquarius]
MKKSIYVERFAEHFPLNGDLLNKILRGHLLVEEVVNDIFKSLLHYPEDLVGNSGTKFDCHQVICLTSAMYKEGYFSKEILNHIWLSVKKLNSLRNHLAHNIPRSEVDHKVDDFVSYVQNNLNISDVKPPRQDSDYPMLYDSILTVHVWLAILKDSLSKEEE